jgi:hypothetical protein|tara:strand:+ start:537 stop:641 length:105 start_codon:yes stop_codon:yes gene_type:complete
MCSYTTSTATTTVRPTAATTATNYKNINGFISTN